MKARAALTGEEALRDLIARGQKRAQRTFMRTLCCPLFFLADRADGTELVIEPYRLGIIRDGQDPSGPLKNLIAAFVRLEYALEQAVRQVVVMEAWMLDATVFKDDPAAMAEIERMRNSREGIRFHPKRYEVIAYAAEDQDGRVRIGRQSIIRPAGARPSLVDDLEVAEMDESEGRFMGMLPPKGGAR